MADDVLSAIMQGDRSGGNTLTTADVMQRYREPRPSNDLLNSLIEAYGHLFMRDFKNRAEPGAALTAAGAGAVALPDDISRFLGTAGAVALPDDISRHVGGELYGPETRSALDEAIAEDLIAGLAGSFAVPVGGAVGAIAKAPRVATAGIAGAGITAGTATANDGADGVSFTQTIRELETERNRLSNEISGFYSEVDKKEAEAQAEAADGGQGPKYRRAKAEADRLRREADQRARGLQAQLEAINSSIEYERRENSPEAIRRRQKDEADRQAKTPLKELYPNLATGTAVGGIATGLTVGALLKGKGFRRYNESLSGLSQNAANTAKSARRNLDAGSTAKATMDEVSSRALTKQADAIEKAGVPYNSAPIAGAFIGGELGANAPGFGDYLRSKGPGDPLYEAAVDSVAGGTYDVGGYEIPYRNLIERTVLAGVPAIAAGKLTSMGLNLGKYQRPPPPNDIFSVFDAVADGSAATRAGNLQAGMTGLAAAGTSPKLPTGPTPLPSGPGGGPTPLPPPGGAGTGTTQIPIGPGVGQVRPSGPPVGGPPAPPPAPTPGPTPAPNPRPHRNQPSRPPRSTQKSQIAALEAITQGVNPTTLPAHQRAEVAYLMDLAQRLGTTPQRMLDQFNSGFKKGIYALPAAVAGGAAAPSVLDAFAEEY